ncbi:MAG: protein kinase [Acidobacteria bacterium]|nr:protein kinase [Acidobacteriota bacterium]
MSGPRRDEDEERKSGSESAAGDPVAHILQRRADAADFTPFGVGEVVADRYRVERLVGRGGSGQVWEVHDLELDQRIALKTLSSRPGRQIRHAQALKHEVQLARRVAHRNVCRVFDIVPVAEHDGEPVWAVTMEFLAGESLAEHVRRTGPLPSATVIDFATQLAAGMAAAHDIGVIHRDLKPENIMLVKAGEATRVVIADFGLAAGEEPEEERDVRLAGSPMTIAPEQIEGNSVGPAADVYACGVVCFHMLTADWPFRGPTPLATALERIESPPPRPVAQSSGVPAALDDLVVRCMARDPASRPVNGGALRGQLEALAGSDFSPAIPNISPAKRVAGFLVLAGLAAFALGDGVGELSSAVPVRGEVPTSAGAPGRPGIALVGFAAEGGDWDWVATALADRFAAVLGVGDELRVISPSRTQQLAVDLGASASTPSARVSGLIGSQTGVQWNLGGSYTIRESENGRPELHLDLVLRGPRARVVSSRFTGPIGDLPSIARQGSEWVRAELRLSRPASGEIAGTLAEFAAAPEAVRRHALGKQAMRRQDYAAAREHFEAAAAEEPGHPLVLLGLAEAWSAAGRPGPAREAAEASLIGIERLDRARQLEVRGRHAIVTNQWDVAEQTYAALFEFYPDDLEYGLLLAESQDRGARLEAALETLGRLRQLPAPSGQDPRIDLTEAWVRFHQGDHVGAVPFTERAEISARRLGQRSQVARALQLRSELLERDVPWSEREPLLAEASELFEAIGDAQGLIMILLLRGDAAFGRGDLAGAAEDQGRAVAEAERIGDKRTLARALTSLAITRDVMGQLAAGADLKERALANYRERDVKMGAAITLENLGISLFKLGRMAESLQRFDEAGQEFARLGDLIGIAWVPYHQGRVWRQLGEVRLARQEMSQARANSSDRPEGGLEIYADYEIAWLDITEDNLERAVAETRRLLERYDADELEVDAAETEVMLAELDVDRGAYGQAIEMATAARLRAINSGSMYVVAGADMQRVHAGLASGNDAVVEEACDALRELVPTIEYKVWELSGRVALARCAAFRGDPAAGRAALARVSEEAAQLGLVWAYSEAVLHHARMLYEAGDADDARTLLGPLRARAAEGGWHRTLRQIDEIEDSLTAAEAP